MGGVRNKPLSVSIQSAPCSLVTYFTLCNVAHFGEGFFVPPSEVLWHVWLQRGADNPGAGRQPGAPSPTPVPTTGTPRLGTAVSLLRVPAPCPRPTGCAPLSPPGPHHENRAGSCERAENASPGGVRPRAPLLQAARRAGRAPSGGSCAPPLAAAPGAVAARPLPWCGNRGVSGRLSPRRSCRSSARRCRSRVPCAG